MFCIKFSTPFSQVSNLDWSIQKQWECLQRRFGNNDGDDDGDDDDDDGKEDEEKEEENEEEEEEEEEKDGYYDYMRMEDAESEMTIFVSVDSGQEEYVSEIQR